MNDRLKKVLRGRKVILGRDFYQFRQVKRSRLTFGNRYADWTFCPDGLDKDAVIYSFGVGEDISFDLKLIEQYKLQVHAFDPSPRSIEWVGKQEIVDAFHFYTYGLAGQDGEITFSEPEETGAHSLKINGNSGSRGGIQTHVLPVHRLSTVLEKLGHKRIDILKMDIEGAEYEVIDDIIKAPVPIIQVLIEFHHRFENSGIGKTREAISKLNKAGYRVFNVSASGEEISFIKIHS